MSPAGPAIARGPEKWSDMGLFYSYHLWIAQVSRPPALAGLQGWVLERLLGGRVVEHLLEGLLQALGLLDLRHRKIAQCVEVRGRRGLYLLDDRLELGAGRLHFLRESGVIFVKALGKRLHRCHKFFGLYGMLHPVQEVLEANDQNGIVDVRVKFSLEARGEHESPTVIEVHQPRVPQTGLLYVLRVGFEES